MVFWDNQKIRARGMPLKATNLTSIAFGQTKKSSRITTRGHLVLTINNNGIETKSLNTKQQLEIETGKTLKLSEYQDIKTATAFLLRIYGFTWDNIPITPIGPNHTGLTRVLSLQIKGSKHIYNFLRAKVNKGAITTQSEQSINTMLGAA